MKIRVLAMAALGAFVAPHTLSQPGDIQILHTSLALMPTTTASQTFLPRLSYRGSDPDTHFLLQLQYNLAVNELWGVGFGVQTLFGKNWFGEAGFMLNQHSDLSTLSDGDKPKSNVFSLSAGYRY
jgi:hypothetical protein